MLGREQKAQLPIAAKRRKAPAYKKKQEQSWAVAAGNGASRPMVGPGRHQATPHQPQTQPGGPMGPPGHIPPIRGPRRPRRHAHDARYGRYDRHVAARGRPPRLPTHRCHVTNPRGPAALGRPWESPGVMSGGRGRFGRLGGALDRQFGRCHLNPPARRGYMTGFAARKDTRTFCGIWGLTWAPGRSIGAVGGRDVARGTCRASALRLGAVKAALHLLGPTIGLKMAYAGCRNLSD